MFMTVLALLDFRWTRLDSRLINTLHLNIKFEMHIGYEGTGKVLCRVMALVTQIQSNIKLSLNMIIIHYKYDIHTLLMQPTREFSAIYCI